MQELNLDT